MSGIGGLLHRYITILQLIPNHPHYITTPDLLLQLESRGISVTARSIQRDLGERLSAYFPLICDESIRPYRWSLDRNYQLNLPVS